MGVPRNWYLRGKNYDITIAPSTALGGAVLSAVAVGTESGYASLDQSIHAAQYQGRRVRFSGWLKPTDAATSGTLCMTIQGASPRQRALIGARDPRGYEGVRGTGDWEERAVVLDVPAGAQEIHFMITFPTSGKLEVRDLAFGVVPAEGRTSDSLDDLPVEPENLNFPGPAALGPPKGWMLNDRRFECGTDGAGGGYLRSAGASGTGGLIQTIRATKFAARTVCFRGQVRPHGVVGRAGLVMAVTPKGQLGTTNYADIHSQGITGTMPWRDLEVALRVPEDDSSIFFGPKLIGTGELAFKDLRLEIVDALAVPDFSFSE